MTETYVSLIAGGYLYQACSGVNRDGAFDRDPAAYRRHGAHARCVGATGGWPGQQADRSGTAPGSGGAQQ